MARGIRHPRACRILPLHRTVRGIRMTRSASRFALPVERAGSRRPVTWVTIVGALLLPVIVGGVLVAALYNPVERLDAMSAAIVNDDEPVTVDGPTGQPRRQPTAGLVGGRAHIPHTQLRKQPSGEKG